MKKLIFSTLCAGLLSAMTVSAADYPGFASSPNYTPNPAMNTPSFRGQSQYASSPNYTPIPGYASYPGFASNPSTRNPIPGYASVPGYASSPAIHQFANPVFPAVFLLADHPSERFLSETLKNEKRAARALNACQSVYRLRNLVSFKTAFPSFPAKLAEVNSKGEAQVRVYYNTRMTPLYPEDISYFSELQCSN